MPLYLDCYGLLKFSSQALFGDSRTYQKNNKTGQQFIQWNQRHKDQYVNSVYLDWLFVFEAQAAIFQLYPGDEYEMDDKMNMK